jgi:hypothetical protein
MNKYEAQNRLAARWAVQTICSSVRDGDYDEAWHRICTFDNPEELFEVGEDEDEPVLTVADTFKHLEHSDLLDYCYDEFCANKRFIVLILRYISVGFTELNAHTDRLDDLFSNECFMDVDFLDVFKEGYAKDLGEGNFS